jgi:Cdc6-like AAA superfamily ATPase
MYNLIRDEIINGVKKNQSYFVTGPAGVGKTHLIKEIHEQLNNEGVNTVLTSTTGINALNLGGITVHKFFGLQIRTDMGYLSYLKSTIY